MKSKVYLALGIIVILVLAGLAGCSAVAAESNGQLDSSQITVNVNNQQGIWVSGEGKVSVTPDIAILSLGVSSQSASVAEAQSKAAAAMENIITVLTENGIDEKDIQTNYYNIMQLVDYSKVRVAWAPDLAVPSIEPAPIMPPPTPTSTIKGYQVDNMVTVKIRATEKTGTIIDSVTAAAGDLVRVNSIYFSVEQPEKYYPEARSLAMADAEAKAEKLAELAEITLGDATYISENSQYQPVPYPIYKGMDSSYGSAPGTSISPGQTDIILNVQVSYSIR